MSIDLFNIIYHMNYQQVYTMECYKRMNLSHNPMSKVQYIHIDLLELNILDLLQ